jgi:hypothetical protein
VYPKLNSRDSHGHETDAQPPGESPAADPNTVIGGAAQIERSP